MEEKIEEETIELKEKKSRTPKQIEAFKKAQEIRKESLKIKREKIQQIKELKPKEVLDEVPTVKHDVPQVPTPISDEVPKPIKNKKKIKKRYYIEEETSSESSSSSDEEVIVIPKRHSKPKKQPKQPESKEIIYKFV